MLRSARACMRTSCSDVLLALTENCCLEPSAIQLNINTDDYVSNPHPPQTMCDNWKVS